VKQVITELAEVDDSSMQVSTVTGGITNLLFKVEFASGAHDPVLVRIFGGEGMIERNLENATYQALARVGIAPRYFGRFENGRIEGFLQGYKDLDLASMAEPKIMRRVAAAMANLHCYETPLELKPFYQTPGMWDQLWSWCEQAKQALGNQRSRGPGDGALAKWGEEVVERYGKIEEKFLGGDFAKARGELQMLSEVMDEGDASPIVFAHNDLHAGNIMAHQETGAVVLIDFEYGGCNYRGFDIANHWNEWAGGTQAEMNGRPEYHRFPSEQQQLDFCRAYLEQLSWYDDDDGPTPSSASDDDVEALVKEARMFVLVNHWYWGLWALNQAVAEGVEEFDYITYAEMRIGQYYAVRDAYLQGVGRSQSD
jgi:ethanolamine kinase